MTLTVLDASGIAAWLVPGQSTPSAEAFLSEAMDTRFLVPFIFPAECRNLFLKAERRKRLNPADVETALDFVAGLNLRTLPGLDRFGHDQVLSLARRERLSFYDALYLKAALEASARIASRDGPLLAAAERCGLAVVDLRV